ncbi:MAG TPA: protein-L-isoaspartate O-methyltransferase [Stellaceae bacterium]|jgi:protein-L-isoaspartate(D-aspartate) O-methyltransferase|nr:protein-L-isoaspartate O-methyltransferase [Stellaceae bacterium]
MIDYAAARLTMVESQLRPNKVTSEALLEAFLAVPRERFVPPALSGTAYVDNDLPLGNGRFLMSPMVLGRLLELAEIEREDRVLEIGCASGYGTAVLARLARSVVAVESEAKLVTQAMTRLRELGIDNAAVLEAPLAAGYPGRAPYDVIVCEGAVERIPPAVAQQLADRGRLVAVMREPGAMSRAVLMTSAGGTLSRRPAFDAAAPPLPGFQAEPSFVF